MSIEYKVPRLLWENFEAVLLAQSKRYIIELAKKLEVSEKELLKRVLPTSDSLKVIIQDSQAEHNQCKAYIQQDKMTIYCRKPVVYGCEYCALHRTKRMMVIEGTKPIEVQKVKETNTIGPMWISDNVLYNVNGNMVGKLNRSTNKIKIFMTSA